MKDQSEQLEEELIGNWDTSKPLPDQIYFIKVFKRNIWRLILGIVLTLLAAWQLPKFAKNSYRSSVFAIFDHVDVSGSGMGTSPQVGYNTVARLFKARFQSQEFLNEIVRKMGGKDVFLEVSDFDKALLNLKGKLKISPSKADADDEKIQLASMLGKMLDPYPEPESGVLALNAYTDSPKMSQDLANQGMELFIRKELEEQINSLDIKLNFLQKNTVKVAPVVRRVVPRPKINKAARVASLKTEDRVRELEDRLRALNIQYDNNRIEKDQALTDIQRELVRLQTNLQPNHPQVLEKRKEIELIRNQYDGNDGKLSSEIDLVRRQLSAQRSSQTLLTEELPPEVEEPVQEAYQGNFNVAVNDRIKDIELEKKNLQRQVEDPSLRTRIRIIFPATYEPLPYTNQRRNFRYATLLLGLGLTFFLICFGEFRNKKARDAWRIERSTGKTLIAQISQKSATEFANISPRLADQLRTHLSKINKVDEPARTLLSYRRLELAMIKNCKGRCIFLVNAGPFDETSQVVKNFLNIYATDHQDDFLLIDCNLQDPVYKHISRGGPDLVDFLEGRAPFEDVVLERKKLDGFAFDVLPPMNKFSGKKTRSFREETIQKVLEKIPSNYKQIFIRSMPEMHFIENMALLNASSDAFIFIDANRTHYFDLHRTLNHLESEKIRGLVAIGT